MLQLWRLTRNPLAKRLHTTLDAAGVTVSVLQVFTRTLDIHPNPAPDNCSLRSLDPTTVDGSFRDADALDRADCVVSAEIDGTRIGSVLLTVDESVYVDALHREFDPNGAYIWRLYVAPESRGRNLGRTLVREALRVASETNPPVEQASALVAPDNLPSQRVFEAVGFQRKRELRYLRIRGLEHRSDRQLGSTLERNVAKNK